MAAAGTEGAEVIKAHDPAFGWSRLSNCKDWSNTQPKAKEQRMIGYSYRDEAMRDMKEAERGKDYAWPVMRLRSGRYAIFDRCHQLRTILDDPRDFELTIHSAPLYPSELLDLCERMNIDTDR
jgi:hypothetical protein